MLATEQPTMPTNTMQTKNALRAPSSPTTCMMDTHEIEALRLRNKLLTEALESIKATADEQVQKHLDLVWFARNRTRFPNHAERKRIESQHAGDLSKLFGPDGDYYHGRNSGCLAAARLVSQQADVLHVNDHDHVTEDLLSAVENHRVKMVRAQQEFPSLDVDNMM